MALTLLTTAVHAGAALALLYFLPFPQSALGATVLAVLGAFSVRERTLLAAPRAPAALRLREGRRLDLHLRGGAEETGLLAGGRYVGRWLVVLELDRPVAGRGSILVARDMLAPESFRQLRLWALWGRLPAGRPAAAASVASIRTISSDTCL